MRINVLGPIQLTNDEGGLIDLAGPGLRSLLAALALAHGRVVPVETLLRVRWDDNPPATARTKIQAHMSALRQAMGSRARDPHGALLTVPPGYMLSPGPVGIDVAEFDDLTARGMRAADGGEPAAASALLGEALALWRGPAFGDVRSGPIRSAAEHLDSRRLLTAETKAEADLVLGRHATVVTELSAWLITHPLRERSLGLTMLALHRLGCRADALGLYRASHQAMGQELGTPPSAWLRSQYQRILADDDAAASGPATGPDAGPRPRADVNADALITALNPVTAAAW